MSARAASLVALAVALLAARAPAARADRADARALLEAGDVRAAAGDADGALDRYRQAIAADPDLLDAYDRAIPLWMDGKRYAEAERYLERATTRHVTFARGWYALGFIYRETGRWQAAIEAYRESAGLQAGDAAPWWGLAASYQAAGRAADAVAAYRRYRGLEHDPARASFRAGARAAIDQLLGPPADPFDAAWRLVLDGGGRAALARAAHLAR